MNGFGLMDELKSKLHQYGQNHLLQYWDNLNHDDQTLLYNDLNSIDFGEMDDIFRQAMTLTDSDKDLDSRMEPLDQSIYASVNTTDSNTMDSYRSTGLKAIGDGKVGVLLLAGGQGTRLGVPYPKGMYDLGLPSGKSLYQIQMERITALERLAGNKGNVLMYIMTSEHTKEPTLKFLEKHGFFGLDPNNVVLFEQRMIPTFNLDGKIILESASKVSRAPDGNGGLYWALKNEAILDDMDKRGVEYLHVYCVDNVLVKVADPTFMGYCISKGAEAGNKVVEKTLPTEKVGVVCRVDNKFRVVEYSEISKTTSESKTGDKLTYNAGNICNHFFTRSFLKKLSENPDFKMIQHVAKKKIPFYDGTKTVKPESINGIKLEKFVFDVFEFTENFVVWDCNRDHEFSPMKNADAPGVKETPSTARNSLYRLHKEYIEKSGGVIQHNGESSDEIVIEISPFVTYDGENLDSLVRNKSFQTPLYLK